MENNLEVYTKQNEKAESEIKYLLAEITKLKECINKGEGLVDDCAEVAKLTTENTKLKHRLAILNRSIHNCLNTKENPAKIDVIF